MKGLLFTVFWVVVVSATFQDYGPKFQNFKLKHNKIYRNQVEENQRFSIFKDNLRKIEEHNSLYEHGLTSYKLGVNQFADMSAAEFRSMLTLQKSIKPKIAASRKFAVPVDFDVPSELDWRKEGYVTEVKNQLKCGSCWAFSVIASTEGQYFRKYKKLVSLSEQQLVDCTTDVNDGCGGGFLEETFPSVQEYGVESEADYPYEGVDAVCRYNSSKVVTKINGYLVLSESEDLLLTAVASVGPVSVAIDASNIQLYESGVYEDSDCSPDGTNHGVTIVGYGKEQEKDYWIVKNSWGKSFGEEGYIRMRRGINQCGIAEDNTVPIIA